mmetsp:Transcript_34760/g.74151  ORF Transcript_34760/g.74151 Transcript_34760/m.74151 type:complete len:85 (+) Transcript_34760:437-691(+)
MNRGVLVSCNQYACMCVWLCCDRYVEEDGEIYYRYGCRCGDSFELSLEQLQSGINAIECSSCSLAIQVDLTGTPSTPMGQRSHI